MNIETSEPDNLARLLLWERCYHIMDGKLNEAPDHDIQVKMELLDVINHAKHAIVLTRLCSPWSFGGWVILIAGPPGWHG